MRISNLHFLLFVLPALLLSACTFPVLIPETEAGMGAVSGNSTDIGAEFKRLLACVEESFPAENYTTNELLPDLDSAWEPMNCESMDQVKVGMSWILNDGGAPWYNAVELGFFNDVCLEAELVRGGSGLGHLQTLMDGGVDFAVSAGGSLIPGLLTGHDGADIVAVGAMIKHSPYIWLGLDHDTPQDQRSEKKLTPQDFIGKRIGLHEGEGYFFDLISGRHGISPDQVELVVTGYSPEPLIEGEMDFTGAWLINEPRLLEAQGYMNWVAFQFSEWGWDDYSEVLVVRRSMLEENADLVRRYLAAVIQGLRHVIEDPEDSAEIAVRYAVDVELTTEQALRRYELQEALVAGADELPLGHMSAERWNRQVASLIQFGQMELPMCE